MLHCTKYGPIGVPNGLVDVQNLPHGRTPCLREYKHLPLAWWEGKGLPSSLSKHSRIIDHAGNQVPKCAEHNKHVQRASGSIRAKHFLKENTGCDLLGIEDLFSRCRGEVGDIHEDIQAGDKDQRDRRTPTESFHWILRSISTGRDSQSKMNAP